MKTLHTSIAALALLAFVSGSAFAEGSRITNSTLNNSSQNQRVTTTARDGGEAYTGAIVVKDKSVVSNSTITNSANNNDSTTSATGTGGGFLGVGSKNSQAYTGSIVIKD